MQAHVHVETERLLLRDWSDADAEPFAALNADPRVMEFFPKALLRVLDSDALMTRIRTTMAARGWGLYAVEEKSSGLFLGFNGLAVADFEAPFTPATEVGWQLSRRSWGNGYATEGARAVVAHAFERLGLDALVAFTAEWNRRSRAVMEKIGMTYDPSADFLHPALAPDHKLARHVLYRLARADWRASRS